jgi:hypothetical protein
LTSINRGGAGHGSLFVTMTRSRRLRFAVALGAAVLFAAAPAVRAYCCVALPATSATTAQTEIRGWPASNDGSGQDHPCCCDAPPASAAVDERTSPKDGAASAGKLPVLAPVLAAGPIVYATPAPRLIEYRAPPPEPALRRSPRRLL